jgi:hypothetical protein
MLLQKRRSQNRKSQQAFRDRQRKRVDALEQKVKELLENYELLQDQYCNLNIAYNGLLRETGRPGPLVPLSSFTEDPEAASQERDGDYELEEDFQKDEESSRWNERMSLEGNTLSLSRATLFSSTDMVLMP